MKSRQLLHCDAAGRLAARLKGGKVPHLAVRVRGHLSARAFPADIVRVAHSVEATAMFQESAVNPIFFTIGPQRS